MKGGLWLIRALLIFVVGIVVLSPLVVHGEASAPDPIRVDHDTSDILLPSSPVYPLVTVYRDMRVSFADLDGEKSGLFLDFANRDASAISQMVQRQEYVAATKHCAIYQDSFDRAVGWMVIAAQHGSDVTSLLSRVKNDHLSQQWILGNATPMAPEWSGDAIDVARRHVAAVFAEALATLEGEADVAEYIAVLAAMSPEPDFFSSPPDRTIEVVQTPSLAFASAPAPLPVSQASAPARTEEIVTAPPPDIASLSVNPDTVEPKETCRVTCNVICVDEDALEYTWWCSKGTMTSNGTTARWTAPAKPGTYQIRVTVMSESGAGDAQSINVSVREKEEPTEDPEEGDDSESGSGDSSSHHNVSPEILSVSVTADHKYLEQSMVGYAILVNRDCTLECGVADSDGIAFVWRCSQGEIAGSGARVVWKAPTEVGNHTVSVTTRNSRGDEDSVTLTFHVTTCSQCF